MDNFVYSIEYPIILETGEIDKAKFSLYKETSCFKYGNCTTVHFECGGHDEWIDTRYVVGISNKPKFHIWTYDVLRRWLRTTIKIDDKHAIWTIAHKGE